MEYINNLNKKERREVRKQEKVEELSKDRQKRAVRKALGWVVILGLIAIGAFAIISRRGSVDKPVSIGDIRADDWARGEKDAPVTLIVYSDFQCPACSAYSVLMEELIAEVPNKLVFVYRHYPLGSIHNNAESGARATEAAGKQGKFWEMHDLLFANQSIWSRENNPEQVFISFAEWLGLDVATFEKDYESEGVTQKVDRDYNEARDAGFNATPTFVINGKRIGNLNVPRTLEDFVQLINDNAEDNT